MRALFIGYGKMGSALGEAWLESGIIENITAIDPSMPENVKATVVSSVQGVQSQFFDIIVAAVKPGLARSAIQALPQKAYRDACLVSVMAGVTCEMLSQAVAQQIPVVRSMPNTPVLIKAGCTGLYSPDNLTEERRKIISELFRTVGKAWWVEDEEQLHVVTAISGSGPAYHHLFSEALTDAGIAQGLPAKLARSLATQTALGAAGLQQDENITLESLRLAVTSPNGTTVAAIQVFEHDGALRELMRMAVNAAHERSIELSRD